MRLFVALDVPENVKTWLARRQAELKRHFPDRGLRWTPPEQWHLTLRFLGETPQASIPLIEACMENIVQAIQPFHLSLGKPGTFSGARMGVLWVGVADGLKEIKELASLLNQSLHSEGFSLETKPFRAHVTLARSRAKIPAATFRQLPHASSAPAGLMDRMHLYQSTLTPAGSIYKRIVSAVFRN